MTREIDRDGNTLIHIEKFVTPNGNVIVKKFADYTDACAWRRNYKTFLEKAGEENWRHEVDSEWVKEEEPEREEIDWGIANKEFAAEYALMCEEID